ncbi:MAG: DUF1919 domain-containing protein [Verrucomicrobiota bacterium]
MQSRLNKAVKCYERTRLRSRDFVLVSNNCWGLECYETLDREYNTPFVGLFIYPADYLKLLENFEEISSETIEFRDLARYPGVEAAYPIGVIFEDVEIHFMHYSSAREAEEKWSRRIARMEASITGGAELLFKMCDRDGCREEDLSAFHQSTFLRQHKKVSFGVHSVADPDHLCVDVSLSESGQQVVDGFCLYQKRYQCFDFAEWVVSGRVKTSMFSRLFAKAD